MNKREQAKAATKELFTETARRLWSQPGTYDAVTIRVLAKACGRSIGSFFNTWDSKEDCWREVMGYEPPVDCEAVRTVLRFRAGLE